MRRYILKRLLHSAFVMWLVATVVFLGMRFLPGGPANAILGRQATDEAVRELRRELGLHLPLHAQYVEWLTDLVFYFDLGNSTRTGGPVVDVLATAAPKTLWIGLVGLALGLLIAIPTGILSATRKDTPIDYVSTVAAFLGISMPAFYIGILLAVLVGVWLGLLPVVGYTPMSEGIIPWLRSILLPGIAVGLPYGAIVMRMTRSALLEEMNSKYMYTARSKGVGSWVRLYKHAFPNALIPVLTIAGIQTAVLLVGSVTVELVFGINGLGRVFVKGLTRRDFPVIQGAILLVAFVMVMANLLVDIAYTVIDPRIKYEE